MALFDFLKGKKDKAEEKVEQAAKEVKQEAKATVTAAKKEVKTFATAAKTEAEKTVTAAKTEAGKAAEKARAEAAQAKVTAKKVEVKAANAVDEVKAEAKAAAEAAKEAVKTATATVTKRETFREPAKPLEAIAKEVIRGEWGNGEERKQKLEAAGFKYDEVQKLVNDALAGKVNLDAAAAPKAELKPIEEVAKEVIRGNWGNGEERKQKLAAAGYDYAAVQAKVNELLK